MKKFFWFLNCLLISATISLSASAEIYTVKEGDTLSKISTKLDFPLSALLNLNAIDSVKILHPGDQLIYISENDRQQAGILWSKTIYDIAKMKVEEEKDELLLLGEAIASNFFRNKIYYEKRNTFTNGEGVPAHYVFMTEKEIMNFIKGK